MNIAQILNYKSILLTSVLLFNQAVYAENNNELLILVTPRIVVLEPGGIAQISVQTRIVNPEAETAEQAACRQFPVIIKISDLNGDQAFPQYTIDESGLTYSKPVVSGQIKEHIIADEELGPGQALKQKITNSSDSTKTIAIALGVPPGREHCLRAGSIHTSNKNGDSVSLIGFGTFSVKERKEK